VQAAVKPHNVFVFIISIRNQLFNLRSIAKGQIGYRSSAFQIILPLTVRQENGSSAFLVATGLPRAVPCFVRFGAVLDFLVVRKVAHQLHAGHHERDAGNMLGPALCFFLCLSYFAYLPLLQLWCAGTSPAHLVDIGQAALGIVTISS